MCDQHKLSDRAFDSQVSADYGNTQQYNGGPVDVSDIRGEIAAGAPFIEPGQKSPIDKARDAYRAVKAAQLGEALGNGDVSDEQKGVLVRAIIAPFYIGDGDINHVALLDALESFKGQPLSMIELRVWGTVVGAYCAQKGLEELSAAAKAGKVDKIGALLTKFLG